MNGGIFKSFFCFSFRPKRNEKEGAALYFSALFFLIVKHAVAVPLKVGVGYLLPELLAHALGILAYLPHAGAMAVALAEALLYQLHYLLVLIKPYLHMAFSTSLIMFCLPARPSARAATRPFFSTTSVGMTFTPNCTASGTSSSTLHLQTSMSSRSLAISSITGAIMRQGPHHVAQKSTSTGLSDCRTSCAKFSFVSVNIGIFLSESVSWIY